MQPRSDVDRQLLARAARWPGYSSHRELDAPSLAEVARRQGDDFATALLYDRLTRSPDTSEFLDAIRGNDLSKVGPLPSLAIVPGACHAEYPGTGADGRRLREVATALGFRVEMVPVDSFGSPANNGQIVVDWLVARGGSPLLLASLSKGTLDVRIALTLPGAGQAFRDVRAWVSLSGIPFGTALAGWFLRRPLGRTLVRLLCRWHGYGYDVFVSLDRTSDVTFRGPPHMNVVHVVGFPLARHLASPRSRRCRRRVAALGPDDGGGFLLGDVAQLPGVVVPVWGADHYLDPSWDMNPLLSRLLAFVAREWYSPAVVGRFPEEPA
jgi:hypothetical protein